MIHVAVPSSPAAPRPVGRSVPTYEVGLSRDWRAVSDWHLPTATPFQDPTWLSTWYAGLAGRGDLDPLLVTVRTADGALALRLPLVLRRSGRLTIVEFADCDLTDFNAPLLGPAAPTRPDEAEALWRAVRRALPRADLVRLTKMPVALGARPNPLALLARARPSNVNGNLLRIGEDYDAWRYGLDKTVRKELERSWRVFSRHAGARFEIVTDRDRAQPILAAMESQQSLRLRAKGETYALDDPDFAAFYRSLVGNGLASGFAVLSALTAGEEIVATLLGVRDANGVVLIRISNAGGGWVNCSPGRLVIERTLHSLHARGCRAFDFSIGNYDYKRRFGVVATPLVSFASALRLSGWPAALKMQAGGELRRYPSLDRRLRAILGRAAATGG